MGFSAPSCGFDILLPPLWFLFMGGLAYPATLAAALYKDLSLNWAICTPSTSGLALPEEFFSMTRGTCPWVNHLTFWDASGHLLGDQLSLVVSCTHEGIPLMWVRWYISVVGGPYDVYRHLLMNFTSFSLFSFPSWYLQPPRYLWSSGCLFCGFGEHPPLASLKVC